MIWPTTPNVHYADRVSLQLMWRPPRVEDGEPFRTCSYCGSIHPGDLVAALKDGAKLDAEVDWKYGWPHKFYIEVRNPHPEREFEIGSRYVGGKSTPMMGKRAYFHAKWYNEHFKDVGFDDAAFEELRQLIYKHSGLAFRVGTGRPPQLFYSRSL